MPFARYAFTTVPVFIVDFEEVMMPALPSLSFALTRTPVRSLLSPA